MNKTSQEIFEEYSADFRNIEDSYVELAGHYPESNERDFWDAMVVKKVETLILLWWDIKEVLQSRGNR